MSYAAFLRQARGEVPSGLTCCYIFGGFLPSKFLCGHHGSPLGHARFMSPWRQSGRDSCVGLARCTQEVRIGCNHDNFGVKCTPNRPYAFFRWPQPLQIGAAKRCSTAIHAWIWFHTSKTSRRTAAKPRTRPFCRPGRWLPRGSEYAFGSSTFSAVLRGRYFQGNWH